MESNEEREREKNTIRGYTQTSKQFMHSTEIHFICQLTHTHTCLPLRSNRYLPNFDRCNNVISYVYGEVRCRKKTNDIKLSSVSMCARMLHQLPLIVSEIDQIEISKVLVINGTQF